MLDNSASPPALTTPSTYSELGRGHTHIQRPAPSTHYHGVSAVARPRRLVGGMVSMKSAADRAQEDKDDYWREVEWMLKVTGG